MRRLRNLLLVSALGLVLSICCWWAYREVWFEHAQEKYSREFIPGTKRQVIESRLLSEGIRFFPESPASDFVSVGFEVVPYGFVCAPREVGLMLQFEVPNGALQKPTFYKVSHPFDSNVDVRDQRGAPRFSKGKF